MAGLEPILADELRRLGANGVREMRRAVGFDGDQEMMYRANYSLRTALRILIPIHSFSAYNEDNLYHAVREVNWSDYMRVTDTLAVDSVVRSEVFRHSQYAALLVKDAIVDQFRDKTDRRPDVNTIAPTLRVNLHINNTSCILSLDTTGDSLHRRGWRRDTVDAPLNEVLAAGMVLLSGWRGEKPFYDPMCGSGTIAIEAALLAMNKSPQFRRPWFGFQKWPDFKEKLWKKVKSEADAQIILQPEHPIFATDKDVRARNATAVNLMSCEMESVITVDKMAFEKCVPDCPPGVLITNPPYDERLKLEDTTAFYKSIGDLFKSNWTGWEAWIISSNREALKHLGLRPSKKITLFNGALECTYQQFEMYEGTREEKETV
jgi:putative N6-adenine-specific DNA methylase